MAPRAPSADRRARGRKSTDDSGGPLALYRKKRDFERTAEPRGGRAQHGKGLSYCIQKHAASSLHYDFRLELDGVLKSWSVPKGPSLDPSDKRLAVQVEDHPVEYGSFEGLIPEGSYGAGTVMLWDRGTWEPLEDARAGFEKGSVRFRLHGEKLAGAWHLVRMGRTRNWLLVKGRDELAQADGELVRERSRSVASERDLATIAREEGGTAEQIERARRADGSAAVASKARGSKSARPTKAKVGRNGARSRPRRTGGSPPRFVAPQLATLVADAPEGDAWLHEVKFDGYRMQCRIDQGRVSFLSRNAKDWSARFPALARSASELDLESALLDGEVVVFDGRGITSFERLKEELGASERHLVYMVFDLLHLDGEDLTGEPLVERKALLAELFQRSRQLPNVRSSDHVVGHGPKVHREACRQGLEGILSKRADAPYRSGRSRDWVKVKCQERQEFVVAGFTLPTHARDRLGSLILGVHDARGALVYAGRVGTGFDARERRELRARLDSLLRKTSPFEETPRDPELRQARWARPELVVEVGFTEWTRDGRLRHPTYQGLREDKPAADVRRERPASAPATRSSPTRESRSAGARRKRRARPAEEETPAIAGVRLTHPDRVLYPEQGLTKLDLANYYRRVAERMLPHLRDRPLTLERCPEGTGKSCFFQKHALGGEPDSIEVFDLPEKTKTARGMSVRDLPGVIALVQLGTLAIHVFGSRKDRLDRPDRLVVDLDPAPDVPAARLAALARRVRAGLADLGLSSFVMTTGGKGLHVVVPIRRTHDFDVTRSFARALAERLHAEEPADVVLEASKAKRKGKIYLDTLRNARGATAVCPYSTRARSGAPVAAPIGWDELEERLADPIDVENIDALLRLADPWRGYFDLRQSLSTALPRPSTKRRRARAAD